MHPHIYEKLVSIVGISYEPPHFLCQDHLWEVEEEGKVLSNSPHSAPTSYDTVRQETLGTCEQQGKVRLEE